MARISLLAEDQLEIPPHFWVILIALIIVNLWCVLMFAKFYRKCSPNCLLVRSGQGGLRIINAGGMFVLPTIHRCTMLCLNPMVVKFTMHDDLAMDCVSDTQESSFTVAIGTDYEVSVNAARRLGEIPFEHVSGYIDEIVQGQLRNYIASNGRHSDYITLLEELPPYMEPTLNEYGFVLMNINLPMKDSKANR